MLSSSAPGTRALPSGSRSNGSIHLQQTDIGGQSRVGVTLRPRRWILSPECLDTAARVGIANHERLGPGAPEALEQTRIIVEGRAVRDISVHHRLAERRRIGEPARGHAFLLQQVDPCAVEVKRLDAVFTQRVKAGAENTDCNDPHVPARRQAYRTEQRTSLRDRPPRQRANTINVVTGANLTIANRKVRDHTITIDGPSANFADVWLEARA